MSAQLFNFKGISGFLFQTRKHLQCLPGITLYACTLKTAIVKCYRIIIIKCCLMCLTFLGKYWNKIGFMKIPVCTQHSKYIFQTGPQSTQLWRSSKNSSYLGKTEVQHRRQKRRKNRHSEAPNKFKQCHSREQKLAPKMEL